jgi:UDP-N-acetyl-D-mannosaminuronic acid dehydrogenase
MGLGNIGLPVALYASKYFRDVVGFDINENAVTRALTKGVKASTVPEYADVYIIAVNTYYRNNMADMSAIESCCRQISALNKDALVCFESTLAVGTARKMVLKYGLRSVAVCPHRWWEDDQENHGVNQLRVLGAYDAESLRQAEAFYCKLRLPLHLVTSMEVAEATKIAENAHRYVEIAFVEELKLIADKNGLDFEEWRKAVNTKWNVNLLEARDGIGKECLPKDTAFLASLCPCAGLLTGAMQTNENYVQRCVKKPTASYEKEPLVPLAKQRSP